MQAEINVIMYLVKDRLFELSGMHLNNYTDNKSKQTSELPAYDHQCWRQAYCSWSKLLLLEWYFIIDHLIHNAGSFVIGSSCFLLKKSQKFPSHRVTAGSVTLSMYTLLAHFAPDHVAE